MCVVMVCLAAVAFAQSGTAPATQNMMVTGSVVSMSGNQVVVRTDAGENMTFERAASVMMPTDIAVGSRVTAHYDQNTAGNPRLTSVALATDQQGVNRTNDSMSGSGSTPGMGANDQRSTTGMNDNLLPQTASPMILIAFAGLASLGGALALRRRRQQG
jgi:LPXTG-motif cell wall-anchored protein